MNIDDGFPTILIVGKGEFLDTMARTLRQDGYMVFEARHCQEALHIVISHSRRIHILIADLDMDGRKLAATVKPYRREMQSLFVTANLKQGPAHALIPDMVLAKVRQVLKLPKEIVADAVARKLAPCA